MLYGPESTTSGIAGAAGAGGAASTILGRLTIFAFVARLAFLATRFVFLTADLAATFRRAGALFFVARLLFFVDFFALRAISHFLRSSCARNLRA
jgi:hypothetical protein